MNIKGPKHTSSSMLDNTNGEIMNGQSKTNGNIGYTNHKMKTKQNKNTICGNSNTHNNMEFRT